MNETKSTTPAPDRNEDWLRNTPGTRTERPAGTPVSDDWLYDTASRLLELADEFPIEGWDTYPWVDVAADAALPF